MTRKGYKFVLVLVAVCLILSPSLVDALAANCLRIQQVKTSAGTLRFAKSLSVNAGPIGPRTRRAMAQTLIWNGQFAEAEQLLGGVDGLGDYRAGLRSFENQLLLQTLVAQGDFGAIEPLLPQPGSELSSLPLMAARRAAAQGDWRNARAHYVEAIARQLKSEPQLPLWMVAEADWLLIRSLEADVETLSSAPELENNRRVQLARAYARRKQWDQSLGQLQRVDALGGVRMADLHGQLGLIYAAAGNSEQALKFLELAYREGAREPWFMLALAGELRRTGRITRAESLERELGSIGPRFIFGYLPQLSSAWQLWGYDVDERAIEEGPEVDLFLYWRRDDGLCRGCVRVEKHRTVNLAFDGSFEWLPANDKPVGDTWIYPDGDCGPMIGWDPLAGNDNHVLLVQRTAQGERNSTSGCFSNYAAVQDTDLYLVRTWVATKSESMAYSQVAWRNKVGWFPSGEHDGVFGGRTGETWRESHIVVRPPTGATLGFVNLVHHRSTTGWVAYDNVLFARIPSEPEFEEGRAH